MLHGPTVSPEEIKRREVVLHGPTVSPEEIKRREVELGSRILLLQLFPTAELRTLSL